MVPNAWSITGPAGQRLLQLLGHTLRLRQHMRVLDRDSGRQREQFSDHHRVIIERVRPMRVDVHRAEHTLAGELR
jgi:hypothetical protein